MRTVLWVSAMLVALGALFSCGKSVRNDEVDSHAGEAGSVSLGGTAGVPGTGGRPSGGVNGAVTGGVSSGGIGTGGDSGRPTGGVAGAAGCDVEEVDDDSLAHCESLPGAAQQPTSSCTLEATCEALHCGDPWSDFDERGCVRPHCSSSEDCGDEERCVPAVLAGELGCYSSVYEWCDPSCSACECGASSDCATAAFCQPAADFPRSADCDIRGATCDEIIEFTRMLDLYVYAGFTHDTAIAIADCSTKLGPPFANCLGTGGAPSQ